MITAENSNLFVHYFSVVAGIMYGLTFNQWMALGNLLVLFFTLAFNMYIKIQRLKLDRQKQANSRATEEQGHGEGQREE